MLKMNSSSVVVSAFLIFFAIGIGAQHNRREPIPHHTTTHYTSTHHTTTHHTTTPHHNTTHHTTTPHHTTTHHTTTPHHTTSHHTTTPYHTTTYHTTTHHTSTRHNIKVRQAPLMEVQSSTLPVLTGRKVAFSVGKATGNLRAETLLHFSAIFANVGGGWDPATSEFVAPYDGLYFFIFHAIGANDTDFTLALTKNRKYEVTAYGTLTTYEHGTNSVVLELKHQDKVALQLQQGAIYEHPGNETSTTFTGFLILDV